MSKNKIVMCDTMIWYDVNDGATVFDKSKYKYYGSVSNIADFLSSDKMKLDESVQKKLKQAIKKMNEEADDIIMVDPTSVGSSEWFKIPIDEEEVRGMQRLYDELLRYANGEAITLVGPTINGLIQSKEKFRDGIINAKKQLVDLFSQKTYTKEQENKIIIKNILVWLLIEWNKMRGTEFTRKQINNGESIEVFVKSYAEFLKTVNIEQLPNKNTMIDLLQLLYIRPKGSTLIWTKETKLLQKIRSAFPENDWKDIIYQDHLRHYS